MPHGDAFGDSRLEPVIHDSQALTASELSERLLSETSPLAAGIRHAARRHDAPCDRRCIGCNYALVYSSFFSTSASMPFE